MSKFSFLATGIIFFYFSNPLAAQVVPDNTLPNNSAVIHNGNSIDINGGTTAGSNLFHSFEQFSLPTGQTVLFNNAGSIENIITRVTGSSISNIDGLIRANGAANLFLLNPNGIIFGPNARLDIGGSFIGTTAKSILFADGFEYSALDPSVTPLLTVSVPVGLGFGDNPGAIQVQGQGHSLIEPPFAPVIRNLNSIGLQTKPGKTLALVGGDVILDGGILATNGGAIEIGSVEKGTVTLFENSSNWNLAFQGISAFRDIKLLGKALVDASGITAGSIQVQGANITLTDGSAILLQNQGRQATGDIQVTASEELTIKNIDPSLNTRFRFVGSIRNETVGAGEGGNIKISTQRLNVRDGGIIATLSFSQAPGGNLDIKTTDFTQIVGTSPFGNGTANSNLTAAAFSSGAGGNVFLETNHLRMESGGSVGTATVRTGQGGNVNIKANFVELFGTNPQGNIRSAITSNSFSSGAAGNLTLNVAQLSIYNGGVIVADTTGAGQAGQITINAFKSISLSGEFSEIAASATLADALIRKLLGLPAQPTGASGDININASTLEISNGASINIQNDGTGNAGTLQINSPSIFLDNDGNISAATASGQGGNILINSSDLRLNNNSDITATAGGTGNGGNININTNTLVGLENSDITANAEQGRGGNISINTQGLFLSPDSNITADSEFSIDGTIEINIPDTQFQNSLEQLTAKTISSEQTIAGSCLDRRNFRQRGSFTYTGVEGLPATPQSSVTVGEPLTEVSLPSNSTETPNEQALPHSSDFREDLANPLSYAWNFGVPIIEGGEVVKASDGEYYLVATPEQLAKTAANNPSFCR